MKASEMLKKECCGNCYNTLTGKADLIAKVEKLEFDLILIKSNEDSAKMAAARIANSLKDLFNEFDNDSDDYYALAYLSQVAFDELKQIELKEKQALIIAGNTDVKYNNELTKANNMVLIGDNVMLAVR